MEYFEDFSSYEKAIAFASAKTERVRIRFNPESGRYDCTWEKAA